MSKFDEAMKAIQANPKTMEEYRSKCRCPTCPTHVQCAMEKGELVYCLSQKSSCITEKKGCHCPGCPVHKELGFRFWHTYYCLKGNEGEY